MGLTEVMDTVNNLGGQLVLSSGDEYVIINAHQVAYGKMAYDLPGVQIEVSLPVGG